MTTDWVHVAGSAPRLTRRGVLQLLLGGLLYLAGANAAAGWVVVLSAAMIGAVPWAWASVWRSGRRVEVRRELPPLAVAGTPVPATLHVRAPTGAHALVRDQLSEAVGAASGLRGGARLQARPPLRRGALRSGEVEVVLTDLLGLARATARGAVPAATDVLPGVPDVAGGRWVSDWAAEQAGDALRAGQGTEVRGLREYRHGDPPKVIHWRSTVRQGRLMARELATEARPRVRVEIGPGRWDQGALDRAAEAACGLAESARAAGHPVEVAMDGVALRWGADARLHLALLPPHAGAAARPLAALAPGDADVTVHLDPDPEGTSVSVVVAGRSRGLGTLPASATREEVSAWLAVRTRRFAG